MENLFGSLLESLNKFAQRMLGLRSQKTPPSPAQLSIASKMDPAGAYEEFKDLIDQERFMELMALRQLLYAQTGEAAQPTLFELHYMLGNCFMEEEWFNLASIEINLALAIRPQSLLAQMRKCLILISLQKFSDASTIVNDIIKNNPTNQIDEDIAGLIGRSHRDLWSLSAETDLAELEQAIQAYGDAMNKVPEIPPDISPNQYTPDNYYPALNWAELSVALDASHHLPLETIQSKASEYFAKVKIRCQAAMKQRRDDSFWIHATLGETYLGLGHVDINGSVGDAVSEYTLAFKRKHRSRQWRSAMGGTERITRYLGYPANVLDTIKSIPDPTPNS